jgi:hypothetical protein
MGYLQVSCPLANTIDLTVQVHEVACVRGAYGLKNEIFIPVWKFMLFIRLLLFFFLQECICQLNKSVNSEVELSYQYKSANINSTVTLKVGSNIKS